MALKNQQPPTSSHQSSATQVATPANSSQVRTRSKPNITHIPFRILCFPIKYSCVIQALQQGRCPSSSTMPRAHGCNFNTVRVQNLSHVRHLLKLNAQCSSKRNPVQLHLPHANLEFQSQNSCGHKDQDQLARSRFYYFGRLSALIRHWLVQLNPFLHSLVSQQTTSSSALAASVSRIQCPNAMHSTETLQAHALDLGRKEVHH